MIYAFRNLDLSSFGTGEECEHRSSCQTHTLFGGLAVHACSTVINVARSKVIPAHTGNPIHCLRSLLLHCMAQQEDQSNQWWSSIVSQKNRPLTDQSDYSISFYYYYYYKICNINGTCIHSIGPVVAFPNVVVIDALFLSIPEGQPCSPAPEEDDQTRRSLSQLPQPQHWQLGHKYVIGLLSKVCTCTCIHIHVL